VKRAWDDGKEGTGNDGKCSVHLGVTPAKAYACSSPENTFEDRCSFQSWRGGTEGRHSFPRCRSFCLSRHRRPENKEPSSSRAPQQNGEGGDKAPRRTEGRKDGRTEGRKDGKKKIKDRRKKGKKK
jgi:hypothetical protein